MCKNKISRLKSYLFVKYICKVNYKLAKFSSPKDLIGRIVSNTADESSICYDSFLFGGEILDINSNQKDFGLSTAIVKWPYTTYDKKTIFGTYWDLVIDDEETSEEFLNSLNFTDLRSFVKFIQANSKGVIFENINILYLMLIFVLISLAMSLALIVVFIPFSYLGEIIKNMF